jgi:hypothetical protein
MAAWSCAKPITQRAASDDQQWAAKGLDTLSKLSLTSKQIYTIVMAD